MKSYFIFQYVLENTSNFRGIVEFPINIGNISIFHFLTTLNISKNFYSKNALKVRVWYGIRVAIAAMLKKHG